MKRSTAIPLALFLISFLIRFMLISKGPYHIDCFDLALKSQATLDTFKLHYLYGSGYPFTVVLGAFFILILKPFGVQDPIYAVNFMSVVFGALCIPALYLVCRKLFNELAAIFSALMFSVIPVFLGVSVYGKNHAPSLFFLLVAVYFLLLYREKNKFSDFVLSGVNIGLLGATRSQDLVLMIPALCFLYFRSPISTLPQRLDRENLKSFFIMWAIAGIIVIGLHLPLMMQKNDTYYAFQFNEFWQSGLIKNFLFADMEMLRWTLSLTETNFTLGGLVLATIGLIAVAFKNRRTFFFLLLWFAVPMLFYANLRSTVERFLIISYIPLVAAQGYLLDRLTHMGRYLRYAAFLIFLVIHFLLLTDIFPILRFRHLNDHLTGYAHWLAAETEPNALIIVGDEDVIIQYYAKRSTLPQLRAILDPITQEQKDEYKKILDKTFQEGKKVYITGSGLIANNPKNEFKHFLEEDHELIYKGRSIIQDWHRGETYHQVFPMRLFEIKPK